MKIAKCKLCTNNHRISTSQVHHRHSAPPPLILMVVPSLIKKSEHRANRFHLSMLLLFIFVSSFALSKSSITLTRFCSNTRLTASRAARNSVRNGQLQLLGLEPFAAMKLPSSRHKITPVLLALKLSRLHLHLH